MKSDPTQTTLHDFQAVFLAAQAAELGALLVGGHAANFWAGLILPDEPELHQFLPFTSKDLDLLGSKDDLLKLARSLGVEAKEMRPGAPTPVLGVIQFTTSSGLATHFRISASLPTPNEPLCQGLALNAGRRRRSRRCWRSRKGSPRRFGR